MTAAAPMPGLPPGLPRGFVERIGAAVLRPDLAAAALCEGRPGGVRDVLILVLPRLVASETQLVALTLVQADVAGGGAVGVMGSLVGLLGALLPDVLLVCLGAIAMTIALGAREKRLRPGLVLDLSAQAWIVWLFVQVLAALSLTLFAKMPGAGLRQGIQVVALGAYCVYWSIGYRAARRAADSAEPAGENGASSEAKT